MGPHGRARRERGRARQRQALPRPATTRCASTATRASPRSCSALQLAGLDLDYVNRRNALVEAVTVDDIARVARRLLVPESLTLVIAGRPEGLDPDQ